MTIYYVHVTDSDGDEWVQTYDDYDDAKRKADRAAKQPETRLVTFDARRFLGAYMCGENRHGSIGPTWPEKLEDEDAKG